MRIKTIIPLAALAASTAFTSAQDQAPVGELTIDTAMVRSGGKPVLNWRIAYPVSTVEDVVTIQSNDSIITDQDLRMDVRLIGVSYGSGSTEYPVDLQIKVGSNNWENTFHGTGSEIEPTHILHSSDLPAGTEVNFAGAGSLNSSGTSWGNSRNTLTENINVIALKNGDTVPTYTPIYNQAGIEDHLSAYLEGNQISIGPRDVIYLMELYTTNTTSSAFDMQDFVLLVTFDETVTTTTTTTTTGTTTSTTTDTTSTGDTTTKRKKRR